MSAFASLFAGRQGVALPSGVVALLLGALLLPASAARAQRLLTLVPGVAQAASAGDPGSMGPAPVAVDVDRDLLRSDPWRLEAPTPDGSVLVAERSVFEDRGGGDLMWSGGRPGAGYDTVVLTVEGGRLVGRFGAAGGGAYRIHAERDGLGGMAPIFGPSLEGWCGVDSMAEEAHEGHAHGAARAYAGSAATDLPERVSSPQGHDRLDILVAYTATAAKNWADRGGALAAIRHAGDYLKMVFRNNRIGVEPHIVHIARASAALDRAGRDEPWNYREVFEGLLGRHDPLRRRLLRDGELEHLRHVHRADLVHLFTGEPASLLGYCGRQSLLTKGETARVYAGNYPRGRTTNDPTFCDDYAVIFVHEIGHALGAHHDPANAGTPDEYVFRPYAFGHGNYDVMPSLGTAMSYRGQVEPFFSTPRLRPWGAVVGIVDKRDNERLLRETVRIGVRYSDHLRSLEGRPARPTDLRVRYDRGVAHLSWRDNAPDADGYSLTYVSLAPCCVAEIVTLQGRTAASIPLERTEPGTPYRFWLYAEKGERSSLASNEVELFVPGEPIAAPSGVSVGPLVHPGAGAQDREDFLNASSSAEVRWTDNSDNETAFEVQILLDGDPIYRRAVEADSERAEVGPWSATVPSRVDYEARVYAYNSSGYSESSETAPFRWAHPRDPPPPAGLSASAIGPTTVRVSWIADPAAAIYAVHAALRGWEERRRWRRSAPSWTADGRAYIDFENLARGGRYRFLVIGGRTGTSGDGPRSIAYLTLGERRRGPAAPSDLAYVLEDDRVGDRVSLSWKDNSNDETGFEVQEASTFVAGGRQRWRRLLAVPADTESVADYRISNNTLGTVFRVFAYNERGYSASSGLGLPLASAFGTCRADVETLCLWGSRFAVKAYWRSGAGGSESARVVNDRAENSGLFHFFGPSNWEILIKVLDGCEENGRVWVLGASTTDLGYRIEVVDTVTGESREYVNEPGRPAPAIVDTDAFACVGGTAGR